MDKNTLQRAWAAAAPPTARTGGMPWPMGSAARAADSPASSRSEAAGQRREMAAGIDFNRGRSTFTKGSDLDAETQAVQDYNAAIHLADKVGDAVTRELLEGIIRDEDAHSDWLEEQLDQVAQMGAGIYLSTQTRK